MAAAVDKFQMVGTRIILQPGSQHVGQRIRSNSDDIQFLQTDAGYTMSETVVNCQSFQCFSLTGKGIRFKGFTITNGIAPQGGIMKLSAGQSAVFEDMNISSCASTADAGAVFMESADLAIVRSVFGDTGAVDLGGAIRADSSTLRITDSQFLWNAAEYGGAFHLKNCEVTLDNVDIVDNWADVQGGGIYSDATTITINGGSVNNNYATSSGGGIYSESSTIIATNWEMSHNWAGTVAGGIHVEFSSFDLFESSVADNEALNQGGAIYCLGDRRMWIESSNLTSNIAGSEGGALFIVYCNPKVFDTRFRHNNAIYGGAVAIGGKATLTSSGSNYFNNSATYGGAVQLENTETEPTVFLGDVFRNNLALTNGGSMELIGTSPVEFWGNASMIENRADAGGSIYWDIWTPDTGNVTHDGNSAIHGSFRASQAKSLIARIPE
eukprot:985726_1